MNLEKSFDLEDSFDLKNAEAEANDYLSYSFRENVFTETGERKQLFNADDELRDAKKTANVITKTISHMNALHENSFISSESSVNAFYKEVDKASPKIIDNIKKDFKDDKFLKSMDREINLNKDVCDIVELQKNYDKAIEDFRLLRLSLQENMERNYIRGESTTGLSKNAEQYRSQDILQPQMLRTQTDPLLRQNISRYSSQEHLYKRRSDMNLEEKISPDFLKNGNRSPYILYNNPSNIAAHREYQSEMRDQAAKMNFERYLKGSFQNIQSEDIGYSGSGSASPREVELPTPSDRLSRTDSMNSRASSAITSVDSGVRMSYIGQHNSLVVVAIDFGTTFSGYAFSFIRDSSSIHMMRRWEGGDPGVTNQKTPTTLLLKPDGSFHSFGFGARDFYHDLDATESKKWLYFDKFKMLLHSSQVYDLWIFF